MLQVISLVLTIFVIDGDTVRIDGERIRIANANAPEIFDPKCGDELHLGLQAKEALKFILGRGTVVVTRIARDRYGRTLARITVDGRDVGEALVAAGLATRGRRDWCR